MVEAFVCLVLSDVELAHIFIGMGLLQLIGALIMIAGSLTLLVTTNWQLTLLTLSR